MAEAAEAVLDGVPLEGLVAVKERRDPGPRRVRVVESGHPIPDARGEAAAAGDPPRSPGTPGPTTSSSA